MGSSRRGRDGRTGDRGGGRGRSRKGRNKKEGKECDGLHRLTPGRVPSSGGRAGLDKRRHLSPADRKEGETAGTASRSDGKVENVRNRETGQGGGESDKFPI